jgi:hypothetical protein
MRTELTNRDKIKDMLVRDKDFLNFAFAFVTTISDREIAPNKYGTILNQAMRIIENAELFDDYDDLDFTFSYKLTQISGGIVVRSTVKITAIVN